MMLTSSSGKSGHTSGVGEKTALSHLEACTRLTGTDDAVDEDITSS